MESESTRRTVSTQTRATVLPGTHAEDLIEQLATLVESEPQAFDLRIWIEPSDTDRLIRDVQPSTGASGRRFSVGDKINIFARTERDCRLWILNIGTSGRRFLIFPSDLLADNQVIAGQTIKVEGTLSGNPGREAICAFASRSRLSIVPAPAGSQPAALTERAVMEFLVSEQAAVRSGSPGERAAAVLRFELGERPKQLNQANQTEKYPTIPEHEILSWIGSGAFGEVWLGRNVQGRYRAIKTVHQRCFLDPRHFDREYRGLERTEPISRTHDGLVDILQIGKNEREEYFYYVMEPADDQVTGREIHPESYTPRTLDRELSNRGRLPPLECVKIGLALSAGLEHFHKHGLVHRDTKPQNVIFVNGVPVLADIGLVTEVGHRSHDGTPGFIPPEGHGEPRGDVYSLGKLLYRILTNMDPRDDFPKLPMDATEEMIGLSEIIVRACEPDPVKRCQSAHELHAALAGFEQARLRPRPKGIAARLSLLFGLSRNN